jgi:hypothetical protein
VTLLQAAGRSLHLHAHCECSRGNCVCNADLEMAAADGATDNSEDAEAYEVRVCSYTDRSLTSKGLEQIALPFLLQQGRIGMVKNGDARWTVHLCLIHASAHVGNTQQPFVVTTG